MEGDRQAGVERRLPHRRAAIAGQAAGQVDGHHLVPRPFRGPGEAQRLAGERPVESRAEQADHDQLGVAEAAAQGRGRTTPGRGRRLGVVGAGRPWRLQPDVEAALFQQPGHDIGVAAVVARAGQHQGAAGREARADRVRHRRAGALHQHRPGRPGRDGGLIGGGHLGDGEDRDRPGHGLRAPAWTPRAPARPASARRPPARRWRWRRGPGAG